MTQRVSLEGIVICAKQGCDHQALFHGASGCTFCSCSQRNSDFNYSQRPTILQRVRNALIGWLRR